MATDTPEKQKRYREEIYENYGHIFQNTGDEFDKEGALRWGKAYDWYLRGWLPIDKSATIAELACGNGKFLYYLEQRGYQHATGVDIAPDQIAVARQVNASAERADVMGWLVDKGESFDVVISLDLIEHMEKDEVLKLIGLAYASLKPGGRVILQTLNADSPYGMQHRYGDITHEWAFNSNQLTRLLINAGFTKVECRELGPVAWGYSLISTFRWIVWRAIRSFLQLWNLAETGERMPVLTRVFIVSAIK